MTRYSPTPAPRRSSRTRAVAPFAALAALAVAAPAATAADDPVVVDPGHVIAMAGDGASAAWLHAEYAGGSTTPTSVTLRVRAADGTVTEVARKLPRNTSDLAYGKDAKGVPTVVLAAGGHTDRYDNVTTTTLYALPADGSAAPRKLPASRPAGAEDAPGLLNGVLSFSRSERTRRGGKKHDTVRLGSLTSSRSRLVSKGELKKGIDSTTPTAGHGVAYVTDQPNDAGAHFDLRILRAGHRSKVLSSTGLGEAAEAGFGDVVPNASGSRITVVRYSDDEGGHPSDRTVYAAPSGRRIGAPSKLQPGEQYLGVPVTGGVLYQDFDVETPGKDQPGERLEYRPTT